MLDTTKRKTMLRQMILVRAFEEKLEELYQRKAMFGSTHSYRGQEAIAVGVCSALQKTDLIASYHRGTGHIIAKGADLYKLLCECMGRADGYSQGRGGKMHMGDMAFGFIGNTGTVGGTVPTATGAMTASRPPCPSSAPISASSSFTTPGTAASRSVPTSPASTNPRPPGVAGTSAKTSAAV